MLQAVLDPSVLIAVLLSPKGAPAQIVRLTTLTDPQPPVLTPRVFLALLQQAPQERH